MCVEAISVHKTQAIDIDYCNLCLVSRCPVRPALSTSPRTERHLTNTVEELGANIDQPAIIIHSCHQESQPADCIARSQLPACINLSARWMPPAKSSTQNYAAYPIVRAVLVVGILLQVLMAHFMPEYGFPNWLLVQSDQPSKQASACSQAETDHQGSVKTNFHRQA